MFENKMWNQDIACLKELIETYGVSVVLEEIAKIIRKSQKEKFPTLMSGRYVKAELNE